MAKAKVVEVSGFSKVPAINREEIDKIKKCLHFMEIKNELWFRFTEIGQLDAIFQNNRGFPNVEFLKISLENKDGAEFHTGEAVASTMWALTSARNPILACGSVTIEVSGISKRAPVLRLIFDVSLFMHGIRRRGALDPGVR